MRFLGLRYALTLSLCATLASHSFAIPVVSGLRLWLEASDPNTIIDNDGDSVASGFFNGSVRQWLDKSGLGNHALQANGPQQMTYTGGALNGGGVVNNTLAGNKFMSGALPSGTSQGSISMFTVYNSSGLAAARLTMLDISSGVVGGRNGVPELQMMTPNNISGLHETGFHNGGVADPPRIGNQITRAQHTGNWFSSSLVRTNAAGPGGVGGNGATVTIKSDGVIFDLDTGTQTWTSENNAAYAVGVQNGFGNNFDGSLATQIVYNVALNAAERTLVDNFLSAENGTPLDPANDKYAGDTALSGDYDFDLVGIGSDVASGASAAGAVTSSPIGQGAGLQILESGGSLADGEYVLAAHKTPVNGFDGTRWDRVFYVDKTGAVDATLSFDYSDAGLNTPDSANPDFFSLLYSATDPFNFSEVAATAVVVGDTISFTLTDALLADGYYTIDFNNVAVPEPATWGLMSVGAIWLARRVRRQGRR